MKRIKTKKRIKQNKCSVYSLDYLKPEVVAVAFAKCSRSPDSFRKIAQELTDEKSADFHEKWVVGYGHSSVAEHATLHFAMENVSILATKIIEDNRLASYTEKSTRYQIFNKEKYYKPKNIMASSLARTYEDAMDYIYDTYVGFHKSMKNFILKKYPLRKNQNEKVYNTAIKSHVCDNIRYLLPTATLTNLGMTANARVLEHAIVKLLSHPLEEAREIGARIKKESLKIIPTLIKRVKVNDYIRETNKSLAFLADKFLGKRPNQAEPVEIVEYDRDAENKLVAGLLYRHAALPYRQIMSKVRAMKSKDKERIIDKSLVNRSEYDQPIREFENIYYTLDILMDYGAFRDIQRHRICTQLNQRATVVHGYDTPEEIKEAGLEKEYERAMNRAVDLYNKLQKRFPEESQYVVPLAFRKRTLFTWNLRELHHFISLRTGVRGHASYRRIAQACWQKINEIHPLLAKYIRVNMN